RSRSSPPDTHPFPTRRSSDLKEYDGGYDDYLRQRDAAATTSQKDQSDTSTPQPSARPAADRPRKLSYKERQELESLPQQIEDLEAEQARLHEAMTAPDYFRQDAATPATDAARLDQIGTEL